jgi:hypothetical protein
MSINLREEMTPDQEIKEMAEIFVRTGRLQSLFKKYIVKRPNGNCQVLFALTELDDLCKEIIKLFNRRKYERFG